MVNGSRGRSRTDHWLKTSMGMTETHFTRVITTQHQGSRRLKLLATAYPPASSALVPSFPSILKVSRKTACTLRSGTSQLCQTPLPSELFASPTRGGVSRAGTGSAWGCTSTMGTPFMQILTVAWPHLPQAPSRRSFPQTLIIRTRRACGGKQSAVELTSERPACSSQSTE